MTTQEVKSPFSFHGATEEEKKNQCPRGNLYCHTGGEKDAHFHCATCCSAEIFTSQEDLKRHQSLHYF